MTDSRTDKLRAAILKALIDSREETTWRVSVDAIVAAITPVLDEGVTVEWAYRYPNGHVATWIPQLMTEDIARRMVAEHPDLLTVVRRRVSPWEDADA